MRLLRTLPVLLSLLLGACAAPASNDAPAPADAAAAPRGPILPPGSGAVPASDAATTINYGCKRDADCSIKDIGSCCGAYPACVNKDSPTDSAGVQARCAARGMVGVCGFPSISACQCVQGRCEGSSAAPGGQPVTE